MYAKYVKLRDSKGMTDAEVSRLSGVPKSTFTDWKSGRSNPKIEKLIKITNALGVSIEDFIK